MKLQANDALSLKKRRDLCKRVVEPGWTLSGAAEAAEVSVRCACKWVGRYRVEGELGQLDRSAAHLSIRQRTSEERVQAIAAQRRLRFTAPEIAETVRRRLDRFWGPLEDRFWGPLEDRMGKLGRLGLKPAIRHERRRPTATALEDESSAGR
jgi:transposase